MNTIEELVKEGIRVVLIISDWLMPDIRGDEFIEIVHAKYPSIKAIMITGNADNEMIEYFRKQNSILAVFKKPWDSEELLTLIRSTFLGDDQ